MIPRRQGEKWDGGGMTEATWETAAWVAGAVALVALLAVGLSCWLRPYGSALAARLSAASAAVRQRDAAARLADQDDLVQTLVVATYALQLDDHERASAAVDDALAHARTTLDRMLAEAGRAALSRPVPNARSRNTPSPQAAAAPAPEDGPPARRRGPRWRVRPAGDPADRHRRHVA
jgi:hypothetical protein